MKVYGQKGFSVLVDSFADYRKKIITEKDPKTSFFVDQSLFDLSKIIYIMVIDGTGKIYKKYIKRFPSILLFFDWLRSKTNN